MTAAGPTRLFNKNYFLLWQGQFVSQIGNYIYAVAMMFWVKDATGSATLMGLIMMVSQLPSVLLGPFGGTFADQYSRRWIIIISDFVNALVVLSLAVVLFLHFAAVHVIIIWLFVVAIVSGITMSFFKPAINAAIPDLVPTENVPHANSMIQSSYQVAAFIGQGVGGMLFRMLGAPILFLINGLSFLFSGISELFIKIPQVIPKKEPNFKKIARVFWTDAVDGMRYVFKTKGLKEMVFAAGLLNFFVAPITVLMPFYVQHDLRASVDWYGYLLASAGVGSLLGYLLAGFIRINGRRRAWTIISAAIIACAGLSSLALIKFTFFALGDLLLVGIMGGFINVTAINLLQLTTPAEIRGRVFGFLGTLTGGLTPVGMGLAGVVADLTGRNIPVIYGLSGAIAGTLVIFLATRPAFRTFLATEFGENNTVITQ